MTVFYKHNDFIYRHPKNLLIDRLTLTYNPPNKTDENNIIKAISSKGWLDTWANKDKKYAYPSKYYRKTIGISFDDSVFQNTNGALLGVDPRNNKNTISFLRMDYNPNKISYEMICACLNDILPNGVDDLFNNGNVTRIDIALDIPLVTPQQIILDYKKTEYRETRQTSGILETLYIGKHDSDNQLVMYDKKKEILGSKLKPKPFSDYQLSDESLTRIELRHRPHNKMKLVGVLELGNLFKPMKITGTPLTIKNDKDLEVKRDLCVLKGYMNVQKSYTKAESKELSNKLNQIGKSNFLKINKLWNTLPNALKAAYPHCQLPLIA